MYLLVLQCYHVNLCTRFRVEDFLNGHLHVIRVIFGPVFSGNMSEARPLSYF